VSGIFLTSPLLSNKAVTASVRLYLSFFIGMILALTLYPDYLGEHSRYSLLDVPSDAKSFYLLAALEGIKELMIGYLLGFMFNLIFEGLMWAGELIDTMIGFSAGQFFDPLSNTFQTLSGRLLMLFGTLLMLAFDFHHVIIKLLAQSFAIVPLGSFHINPYLLTNINAGTSLLFVYAVLFGAIPLVVLICALVGMGFIVRAIPEMNLLVVGAPLRILIGLYILMIAIAYLPPLFSQSFTQISTLTHYAMEAMGRAG
jgi:flagellar biosynthetic protein FliR